MSEHCPDTGCLLLYLAGELDDDGSRDVREHVSSCVACGALTASLERVTRRLREAALSPVTESSGCLDAEMLAAYVDGTLQSAEESTVEEHLAGCGSCLREAADLIRLAGPEEFDTTDASVSRVLSRLSEDSRTAVVKWKERSMSVVRGFASAVQSGLLDGTGVAAEPAFATARDSGETAALAWNGDEGSRVLGLLETSGDSAMITGRVSAGGGAGRAVSISLASSAGRRGPESPDSAGKFGPWPVGCGRTCSG